MKKPKTYKLFIDGKWVPSVTRKTFSSINPTNSKKTVACFFEASVEDTKKAIDSAQKAFPKWSNVPAPSRAKILFKAGRILEERKKELAKMLSLENGKVLSEALGEIQEAIDITFYAAGEGRRLLGETTPSELKEKFCFTVRKPIGVVGLICPFNFPIAIPAWKIAPALVSGNTIVFKPAEDTPLLATLFVEILEQAGVPKGVLNLVQGKGEIVGQEIVKNKKVEGISFTGSKEVGSLVLSQAAKHLKHVSLELGGKNPIIVLDDADLKLALDGVIWGAFGTCGQRCTAASRLILHKKIRKKFEKKLLQKTKKLKLGNPLNPKTDLGPIINQKQLDKIQHYCDIGIKEAKLLLGGRKAKLKAFPNGFFFEPTIFSNVQASDVIAQEEIFGPVLSIIECNSLNEAIKIANSVEFGLSSAIYTKNVNKAFKAIEGIEAGLTYVNSSTIGSEVHLPFGGIKGTGNGWREAGTEAVKEFTEIKTVYIDFSEKLQKAQIDVKD